MSLHLTGIHSQNSGNLRIYYGNNRYYLRYPFAKQKLTEEVNIMYQAKHEDRQTHKKKQTHSGFTGMFLLNLCFQPLYGFDVLRDFVFDVFHEFPLNVIKNILKALPSK